MPLDYGGYYRNTSIVRDGEPQLDLGHTQFPTKRRITQSENKGMGETRGGRGGTKRGENGQ